MNVDNQGSSQPKQYCSDLADTVKIRLQGTGIESVKPITIPNFICESCNAKPNVVAFRWKHSRDANAQWHSMTYADYHRLICEAAKSFLKVWISLSYEWP